MCKSLLNEKEMKELKEKIIFYRGKISEADKERSEILHHIETYNPNAYEMVVVYKELREVQQLRRVWKTKLYEAQREYNSSGGDKYLNRLEKNKKRSVKKVLGRKSWFDNFSSEALAILNNQAI